MSKEFQTVIMAGLLHDIGKFYQKGDSSKIKSDGKHPLISHAFVEKFNELFARCTNIELLKELVLKHHENSMGFPNTMLVKSASESIRHLAKLLSRADNISSTERDDESVQQASYRTRPLASVFSSLEINHIAERKVYSHKPEILSPYGCFPERAHESNAIGLCTQMIEGFTSEVEEMEKRGTSDFDTIHNILNSLLLKYAWWVPSCSFDRIPDISLYDHLKTTSAIAACLYLYHNSINNFSDSIISNTQTEKFRVVLGDFSGIQNYIFGISSIGSGGIAKRLRARSFYVNTLLDIVSHEICYKFGVPLTNILISAGGKFYILLPNVPDSETIVETIRKEVEAFLFKESSARIAVNLVHMPVSSEGLLDFNTVTRDLNLMLGRMKKRSFETLLIMNERWNQGAFEIFDDLEGKVLCNCCRSVLIDDDGDRICKQCSRDEEMGRQLANVRYISYNRKEEGFRLYKNYSIKLHKGKNNLPSNAYLVSVLNVCDFSRLYHLPLQIRFMSNHIPTIEDTDGIAIPITFQDIALQSTGKKYLGVYKADVDNLGFLFMEGLKRTDEKHRNTISRITTLSRMLEMFFSGYINRLVEDNYTSTYSVFAGGDDLFLIGPWDKMSNLALDINKAFERYTSNNPDVTLSAAVVICKPDYPVQMAAEEAEDALDSAKKEIYTQNEFATFHGPPKNRINFLDNNISWGDYEDLLKDGEKIARALSENQRTQVTTAKIWRLLRYGKMFRRTLKGDASSLRYIAYMHYDIERNYNGTDRSFTEWVKSLRVDGIRNKKLFFIDVIGKYALLKTRTEG